ncbi:hypothetical protein PAXRUDRAFT_829190 [Paxillus rubicundulus Ve08.2h10]|uniref:Uncharacterized protein n=1 Tax=Paxillus rubicundulus Ve08.2h10 TaxID=930991 RepID=A0A0D0DN51_9AGAM|nr:hypothetical protein PAXRUDRAFT_829190 [Paxillus rubicundulus Ve08.2h10]
MSSRIYHPPHCALHHVLLSQHDNNDNSTKDHPSFSSSFLPLDQTLTVCKCDAQIYELVERGSYTDPLALLERAQGPGVVNQVVRCGQQGELGGSRGKFPISIENVPSLAGFMRERTKASLAFCGVGAPPSGRKKGKVRSAFFSSSFLPPPIPATAHLRYIDDSTRSLETLWRYLTSHRAKLAGGLSSSHNVTPLQVNPRIQGRLRALQFTLCDCYAVCCRHGASSKGIMRNCR